MASPAAPAISEDFRKEVGEKLAQLAEKLKAAPAAATARPLLGPFHEAASVLAWFDPEALAPTGGGARARAPAELLADSMSIRDSENIPRWTLQPGTRIAALRQLREKNGVEAALRANDRPADPVQKALDEYLAGTRKPLAEQSLSELTVSYDVSNWLTAAGFAGIAAPATVEAELDRKQFLQTFELIAGDRFFRGRSSELQSLRDYVGVLPPNSLLGMGRRLLERVFSLTEKPPLMIYGPGGVGKSTLVGRFILEHARAAEQDRFPFIYIDFDRPEIEARYPHTLLIEAVTQLGLQYPEAKQRCGALAESWRKALASSRRHETGESYTPTEGTLSSLIEAIHGLADLVASLAPDRPVVLVLDTLEEVQYVDGAKLDSLWPALAQIQKAVPRMRMLLAGRSEIEGRPIKPLELTGLDPEAAEAYLLAHGFTDRNMAREVAGRLQGSPLSLKLAAELASHEGAFSASELKGGWFARFDAKLLQRHLYDRVLAHIHDADVRKLAHPGLILRRITPEIILKVLAEPCGLAIDSISQAQALMDKLRRELALVTTAGPGAVRHRPDLRALMLDTIRADLPRKFEKVQKAAIEYYNAKADPSPEERAEEIYHRLRLDQPFPIIDGRWMPGVEQHLRSALPEFTGRCRAYLARRLGLSVDEDTLRQADLEDWETLTAHEVDQLMAQALYREALARMRQRPERSALSPLPSREAAALIRVAAYQEAQAVVEQAIERAAAAGHRRQAYDLALIAADIALTVGDRQLAEAELRRLRSFGDDLPHVQKVQLMAREAALLELADEPAALARRRDEIAAALDQMTDLELALNPVTARWAGTALGPEQAEPLARVVRTEGLSRQFGREMRALGFALATYDVEWSRQRQEERGGLARRFDIKVSDGLTRGWNAFLLDTDEARVADVVAQILLGAAHEQAASGVFRAVAGYYRAALGLGAPAGTADIETAGEDRRHGVLSEADLRRLVDRLAKVFDPKTFAEVLRHRLQRRVEAISARSAFPAMVADVVHRAEAQGWLVELISAASAARRGDPELARLARAAGVGQVDRPELEGVAAQHPQMNILDLERQIAMIEPRICRLERKDRLVATGFLVGPGLVVTADLSDREKGGVRALFDRALHPGSKAAAGPAPLARLIASRRLTDGGIVMGLSIFRLEVPLGILPVGTVHAAESTAELRGWIEPAAGGPKTKDTLLLVHQASPSGATIQSGRLLSAKPRRLRYDIVAHPGSAGAPLFDSHMRLAGMHIGAERDGSAFGIAASLLWDEIRKLVPPEELRELR